MINMRYRYILYENGAEELYDLQKDPEERNNIANQEAFDALKTSMRKNVPKTNVDWKVGSNYSINAKGVMISINKKIALGV